MIKVGFLAAQSSDVSSRLNVENTSLVKWSLEGYNSPSTKMNYKVHLSLFCKYHSTDLDSLVLKARTDKEWFLAILHILRK
jgi:hypothetical protein